MSELHRSAKPGMKSKRLVSSSDQWIARIVFCLGMVWVIPGFIYLRDAGGKATHLGWTAFWIVGSLLWLGWGIVAFTSIQARFARAIWISSAIFHGFVLVVLLLVLAATWISFPERMAFLWFIPAWWLIAAAVSLYAYGMLRLEAKRTE